MDDEFDLLLADRDAPDCPETASTDELGDLLGITGRAVTELARKGVLKRASIGRWPVRESVRAYCAHLREQAAGRAGSTTLTAERTRLAKQQADAAELKNAALRGELVAGRDVERGWASILRDVRSALLAVASRCGANLPHLTSHDVSAIDSEIRKALEALADGN